MYILYFKAFLSVGNLITDNFNLCHRVNSNFDNLEIEIVVNHLLLAIGSSILDDVLTVIHEGNLLGGGGVLSLLVVPDPYEPREPQADPLVRVHPPDGRLVDGGDAQVGTLDLPHLDRLKPVVGLVAGVVVVISLGFLRQVRLEEAGVLGQVFVGETSPDLTNALVFFILWVIAGEEETTVTKKRKFKSNLEDVS